MALDQLPGRVREFVNYLNGLLARLDQGGGWCAVFWQRDPDGMRACLEGRELPPWDVLESVLQDLAAEYGPGAAAQEKERARGLHSAALAAYDARPGGREALGDRLDVMLREQRYAAERQAELGRLLASATTRQEADAVRLDLAWARDDHERATARCAELRSRMADLDHRSAGGQAAAIRRARIAEGAVYRIDREFAPDEAPSADTGPGAPEAYNSGFPQQRGTYDPGAADGRQAPYETGASGATQQIHSYGRGPAGADQGPRDSGPVPARPGFHEAAATGGAQPVDSYGHGPAGVRSGSYTPEPSAAQRGSHEAAAPGGAQPVDSYGRGPAGLRPGAQDSGPAGVRSGSYAPEPSAAQRAPYESGAPGTSQHRAPFEAARPASYDGGFPSAPQQRDADAMNPGGGPESSGAPQPVREQPAPEPPAPEPPTSKQRKRRRGSARFAGMAEEEAAPVAVPPTAAPVLPAPEATGRSPRGARFAGAAEVAEGPQQPTAEPLDTAGPREVAGTVERLVRLRAEGHSGEAHALLVEAAYWPAARFPLLAAGLQRAGLGADWATLLWEAASLPADRLVAAADALVAAGRGPDGEQILRQGVARPATEIGQAVLGLAAEGRHREVRALLDAYVRVRTPEEAARSAEPDPGTLVPLLVEAAKGVSDERHWDLVHALRVAGFTA
ncbi:hypothetical protein GCM10022403_098700 [Streptomyces coacervatus]|uniref:UL36 very large tegument protein n=1 Tax=Streptomyces coacervatus TaxID=647381 RepID=A0ABP7JQI1_9ACTN|nr:hypothetical protein [Streptomyces coacervatus]MDF2263890.1 hypothetical protein [Streptomyces coacervatus]